VSPHSKADIEYMRQALELARAQLGRTGANPAVGCLIVRDGEIVGAGATADSGRPHAEAVALERAGDKANGATVYVSLEPCAHQSLRGPTCSTSLIAAGVFRVVASVEDPDPRTKGQGFQALRNASILVEVGLLSEEGLAQIKDFAMPFSGQQNDAANNN
jgi:diaminohydroxyphosphoribosylaminopyrimidine deaminase / 5-amino-6-(5-phosphoribosylamino)uracil reductase